MGGSGLDRRCPVLGWGHHRCRQGGGEDCQGSRRSAAVGRRLVAPLAITTMSVRSSSGAWRMVTCAPRHPPSRGSAPRPRSPRFSIQKSTSGAPSCSMPGTRRRHTGLMRCSGSTASIRCRRRSGGNYELADRGVEPPGGPALGGAGGLVAGRGRGQEEIQGSEPQVPFLPSAAKRDGLRLGRSP